MIARRTVPNDFPMSASPIALAGAASVSRRDFLRATGIAAAAITTFPTIIPGSALGKDGTVAPSNRVTVVGIGCGPQGIGDLGGFLSQKDCQVVAVCDVKADQLERARASVNGKYQNQDCRTYTDLREVVARKDIDACLIATPDHWHVPAALAAVNSGKDVYVEKPLGLSLEEGQLLRAAIHRRKRIFQFGTQQRSDRNFRLACELVRNGAIGRLQYINVWAPGSAPGGSRKVVPVSPGLDYDKWVGPAAFRPHTENLCSADGNAKTWWFISDFALGFIAGWGIHPIDIAAWGGGDLLDGVATIEGRGNFRSAEGICDTATIWEVDWRFPSGVTMKFIGVPNGENRSAATGEPFLHGDEWRHRYGQITSHGTAFEGGDGWVQVHRGALNVHSEELKQRKEDDFKFRLIRSSGHVRNFLDCVKSRAETVCSIDTAMISETMCHVSDIAIRLGRKVTYDFKKERFIGDDAANQRLKMRPMRKPWQMA